MELFFANNIVSKIFELPETEAHHVLHVLRYEVGDELNVTDGKGNLHVCKIILAKKKCEVEIVKSTFQSQNLFPTTIAIAPTKSRERLEWFLEKATELGVSEIQLLKTQHAEKWNVGVERLEKVLIAAIKQSFQTWLPVLKPVIAFEKFVAASKSFPQKLICHNLQPSSQQLLQAAQPKLKTVITIGPEGGFSDAEINFAKENNFKTVLLGNNRLRTETAGVTAAAVLQQINCE